ncbi:copper amine oxidase N-terminal domain-containing protein [Gorillibacterium sp. sgz500922]|uniref:copper amine oxidase N-terminal domain-containing protein n=1 Tax=Gorillibacterium sp. sgz500922 TaxID=3446694 RepID=UPI003F677899
MKKFLLGLLSGALLAGSTAAIAAPSLQAKLTSALFEINGQSVHPDSANPAIEVNGRTYVPLRFVAEELGAVVGYEADSKTVRIRNGPLTVADPNFPGVSVGNLVLTRSGGNTAITGHLQYAGTGNSLNRLEARLTFYDAANRKLGAAAIKGDAFGVETKTFSASGSGDLRAYQTVLLDILSVNGTSVSPAPTFLYEDRKQGFSLALPDYWKGKFTVETQTDPDTGVVSLRFVDKANQAVGGTVFTLQISPKKQWEQSGKAILEIVPSWVLGETGGRVFAMIAASDVQYNTQDPALTEEYTQMRQSLERVRVSFAPLR